MKGGLLYLPQLSDLQKAYDRLLHQQPSQSDIESLALYSQWCRFDARLAEIWVNYLRQNWQTVSPTLLNDSLLRKPWPSAAAVLLEFVQIHLTSDSQQDFKKFKLWKDLSTFGFLPAPCEIYFIGLLKPGGKSMLEDARFSLTEYSRWGYLGREILITKSGRGREAKVKPRLSRKVRYQILLSLYKTNPRVITTQYWEAIDRSVSLRQAERDLKECPFSKPSGNTKGRFYLFKGR